MISLRPRFAVRTIAHLAVAIVLAGILVSGATLAQQSGRSVDRLEIERIGGLAGFGGPHLKSRGEVALSDLSPADRQTVDDLFNHPEKVVQEPRGAGDVFRYRIMRHTAAGAQTIEVPENAVPAALRDSVKDVLE